MKRRTCRQAFALFLLCAVPAQAHEPHSCPAGFNDTPAMSRHLEQRDIAKGRLSFEQVFDAGQQLFVTDFNICDGAGRPGTTGGVTPRTPDPLLGPRFTRVSAPETDSCAGCHVQPQPGGAGDFVGNVFVLAQIANPVSGAILDNSFQQVWLERNTLGMFGSGAIELLGREMTADLQAIQNEAIAEAQTLQQDIVKPLVTKSVSFGSLTAHPDGSLDTSKVEGVDVDLIVKPFSRKGMQRSVREFTVGAMNQHHGMQAVERFGEGTDPDQDGVKDELTIGDITAVSVFQEALPVPVRRLAGSDGDTGLAARGERVFAQVGCAECHLPSLHLNKTVFCDPDPLNPTSGPNTTFADTSQSLCFDLQKTSGLEGNKVNAYTDLKRHVICDPKHPHYCNEPVSPLQVSDSGQAGPENQFLTAKLWDVGNSAPYGHRGDLDTIYAAIVNHGGEAAQSEGQFAALSDGDQQAVVTFLKTLKMPIIRKNPPPQFAGSPRQR